jgi:hypothetical protein
MPDGEYIYFKCLEVQQPIGSFYLGAMPFNQVTFISHADVRRIEERDVERSISNAHLASHYVIPWARELNQAQVPKHL